MEKFEKPCILIKDINLLNIYTCISLRQDLSLIRLTRCMY